MQDMERIYKYLKSFPLKEKNNYNWKLIISMIKGNKDEENIYLGINNNNEKDIILVKEINIDEKKEYNKILKELIIIFALKNREYFPKNISKVLSNDNQYLYLLLNENIISLNYLINSKQNKIYLSNELIKWVIYQISYGLNVLHSNNIIHHDIKPSNILIDEIGGIKISNFSCSIFKGEESSDYTLPYASPELLIESVKIDEKIDMWGLGLIIIELFTKKSQIFKKEEIKDKKEQLKYILSKFGINENYSINELKKILNDNEKINFKLDPKILEQIQDKEAIKLINNLLTFNPNDRYTAKQALESDYLKEYNGVDDLNIKPIVFPIDYNNKYLENKINKKEFIELITKIN